MALGIQGDGDTPDAVRCEANLPEVDVLGPNERIDKPSANLWTAMTGNVRSRGCQLILNSFRKNLIVYIEPRVKRNRPRHVF